MSFVNGEKSHRYGTDFYQAIITAEAQRRGGAEKLKINKGILSPRKKY
jgi:hypothetical protein